MSKLAVEVLDASDLMPKDGQGSASPFVEIDFDEQRHRTQTKHKDLSPVWNEKFVFNVSDPRDLHNKTIDVLVYNDRKGGHHKNFLGRVRISGVSVASSESEAVIQRCPLEKRGFFSNIRGDIALKVYFLHGPSSYSGLSPPESGGGGGGGASVDGGGGGGAFEPPLQELHSNNLDEGYNINNSDNNKKKKKKEKEVKSFYSVGTGAGAGTGSVPPPASFFSGFGLESTHQMKDKPAPATTVETRSDFARAGQATAMLMQFPGIQNPDQFGLIETSPPLSARRGYWSYSGSNKTSSTYDLVEQMYFLYVSVVKAKDLPSMDLTGSLDPYVEVKLGNYKGVTKHLDKNQNPIWKQIFAFSKERLQSNLVEVTVKDKDFGKDDFVGRVSFDLSEVPLRVPPDSPLAPQWYKLEDKKGEKTKGELMLAIWMGTQADESFPEAWHSDAHSINHESLANTRSKVYFSPKLCYLRVQIIEAQDLVPSHKDRGVLDACVKIHCGNQHRITRTIHMGGVGTNPKWNEELMFVVSEPMEERIVLTVEELIGPSKFEVLGELILPISVASPRLEPHKPVDPRWFNLVKPSSLTEEVEKKKEAKFSSKIHLRLCLEVGYHVLDESTHYSSDFRPSSKYLWKPSIGVLEIGILSARNLLPMKTKSGRTTDAYCVAKYGNKWVRTRTLLDTLTPRWNEQYTWEVYDPYTVITIGVFDNCHINGSKDEPSKDQRIGKVRIRLSTLEIDHVYTHYYPLLVLQPSGLKKTGELHLALRFKCTTWVNMVSLYGKPLLPKAHYIMPIPIRHLDWLRHQAMQLVAARLARAEPPLRKEAVEYMLDVDQHMWSLRRSRANFNRIMSLLLGLMAVGKWFDDVCNWKNPVTTCLVHVLFLILVCYPELILPTVFLYLFVIGVWNYRFRPRKPPHMDARLSYAHTEGPFQYLDELDEEFDTFPTSRPQEIVRMRYDRLRSVAGKIQTVAGDLATQGERAQAILSWRDPRATTLFIIFSLICAVVLYVTPFQVVAVLVGLYLLRHPRFRSKMPSVPFNFFRRLPSKTDLLL